jgi:putative spermidine/putrescine transport system permease protein
MLKSTPSRFAWGIVTFLIFGFLIAPLLVLIAVSFNQNAMVFPPRGLTFHWYATIFDKPDFLSAAWASTVAGTLTAVIATCSGLLAALGLRHLNGRTRNSIQLLLLSPLFFPAVIIALAIFQLLVVFKIDTNLAVLVGAHVVITMPYPLRNITAQLSGFDRRLEEAAMTVGATPRQALLKVTIPLLKTSIVPSLIITFILSWNNFTLSVFLANSDWTTLPLQLRAYLQYEYEPFVAAMSTILILISAVLLYVMERLFRSPAQTRT